MRRIYKVAEPAAFAAWKAAWVPPGIAPAWDLPDPPRSEMRAALEVEQRRLCCYCVGSISSGAYHIEHFRPRSLFAHLTYQWPNLLASCQGLSGVKNLVDTRRHCGAAKDNWFGEGVTVDPTRPPVEALFRFPLTGKVFAAKTLDALQKNAVETTIEMLNLNAPVLVGRREAQLSKASADVQILGRAAWHDRYLKEHVGQLQEFWPALKYNFEKLWRDKFVKA